MPSTFRLAARRSIQSALVGVLLSGLSATASTLSQPAPGPEANNLHYADVVRATAGFDELILWEGLPHPVSETDAFSRELATRKTFRIGDQNFYAVALPLKDEEKTAISSAVLNHIENFKLWSGYKFCGGFHADYAVEWRAKGATLAQALVCFSCAEAEFRVGDRVEEVDQSDVGVKQFRTLLLPHRQQRPAFRHGDASTSSPAEKMIVPKVESSAPTPITPRELPKMEVLAPPVEPPATNRK